MDNFISLCRCKTGRGFFYLKELNMMKYNRVEIIIKFLGRQGIEIKADILGELNFSSAMRCIRSVYDLSLSGTNL